MNLFREVADIKTADQLHLPTPEVEYHNIVAQPTEQQQEMVKALSERASLVHSGTVDPSQDNMLKITSDGRKLGLDQRIINQALPDEPGTKVNQCVANILQIWRDGEADKLTQLVFCDISTPQAAPSKKEAKALDNPTLHALEQAVPLDEPEPAFTIYEDIRQKLIAQGMPAEQIAFIHEAKTEVQKKELFAKVRTGQVRVLLGSTAKMGAGTNVQDRLVALHDLDCPWRPGDLAQRKGRIERQGNQNPLVHVYRYVTEGTFDAYPVSDKNKLTTDILSEVCPMAEEWELLRELSYLEVREDVLWRPFFTLSNGEQTKVLLAALFLNDGHFLLIDEPTNHLDMKARETVSAYLKRKKGFILVSHDRCFLDGCVDHILSINRSNIEVQSGNFSTWFTNFQRQQEFELAQNVKLSKEIERMKKAAQQSKGWSIEVEKTKNGTRISGIKADKGHIGHKAAKMMKRSKSIEARQQRAIGEKSRLLKNLETVEDLKLTPLLYFSDTLVTFSDVVPIFDGKDICQPISFDIKQGERIVLDGKNGSGKTSLLKLLMGQQIEHRGTVAMGSGMILSYVPQDTSMLNGSLSEFANANHIDESLFKAILRKMDFSRIQFEKKMEDFSAGQKKKVLIAKSLCEQAHLYVWDEPLNYVDIYSRMQIENLIKEFSPTMIFVEHDLAFRNAIATQNIRLTVG